MSVHALRRKGHRAENNTFTPHVQSLMFFNAQEFRTAFYLIFIPLMNSFCNFCSQNWMRKLTIFAEHYYHVCGLKILENGIQFYSINNNSNVTFYGGIIVIGCNFLLQK